VLALLAVQPGKLVRREAVIDALWGLHPPTTAEKLVQAYVSRLRRILDPADRNHLIQQGAAGYRLRAGSGELDVAAFAELAGQAEVAAEAGDAELACRLYELAMEMWRGEPAEDAEVLRDHPALADLTRRRADAVLRYADSASGLGRHDRVTPLLESLAREDPLSERVHARLIVSLAGSGQQAAAVRVYKDLLHRLADELGVDPSPELSTAYQRVLRQDIPLAAKKTMTAGRVSTHGEPHPVPGVRCSLPPDTATFVGRQAELDCIVEAGGTGGMAAVHSISGMPGIGKTALAVHAAHLLRDQFPERQLFLSLHGHTPGQRPVAPEDALAGLLAAVGIDARNVPEDLDERSALWRERIAGQKVLLVLDNAAGSDQVRPLLPESGSCMVLVTSRRHLGDLPGTTTSIPLEALPAGEAIEMFTLLAPHAADSSPETVAELSEMAGCLPLAISLLARVSLRHPSWTLEDLAAETRSRLLTLAAESDSVAAAFAVSYQGLDPGLQEFFRFLSLHPGTTVDGWSAAALSGGSPEEAASKLDSLHGEGLLTEVAHRRYAMHDLTRRYAQGLAATDPADRREQALERLLDYYQDTAALAELLLARQARTTPACRSHLAETAIPVINGAAEALAWARAERTNLLACLDQATAAEQHARVIALTASIASLLRLDGPWLSAVSRHTTAVTAARQVGDPLQQANALIELGSARRLTGDHHSAVEALQEALGIYRDISDEQGQAIALMSLADVWLATGDGRRASDAMRQAVNICPSISSRLSYTTALTDLRGVRQMTGDHHSAVEALQELLCTFRSAYNSQGQAIVLTFLGVVRLAADDHANATEALHKALTIYREVGEHLGTATALTYLGDVHRMTGDHHSAVEALNEALTIYRTIGHQLGTATALTYLGDVHRMTGDHHSAVEALREALEIYRTIGDRVGEDMALNGSGTVNQGPGKVVFMQLEVA
jgi:DNA-binding SARP family transcriptional activator